MRIAWLYSGDDGESHFAELDLPVTTGQSGWFTDFLPAEGVLVASRRSASNSSRS